MDGTGDTLGPRLFRGVKEALRQEARCRLRAFSPEEYRREGAEAAALAERHPRWGRYETILLFLSMKYEIDTFPLLNAALKAGKRVFVPRIRGDDLRFCRVWSAGGPWVPGPLGIREPPELGPMGELLGREDFPALVFTPALAFDRQGRRLGRGKGYYDRFLAGLNRADYYAAGLCLERQVLPRLPADVWDKPVDALCTGRGFIPAGDGGNHGTD